MKFLKFRKDWDFSAQLKKKGKKRNIWFRIDEEIKA